MKYVVIVDSMSNMPEHVFRNRDHMKVVPLNTLIGKNMATDLIDTESLNRFYTKTKLGSESKMDATSPTAIQLMVFLLNELFTGFDAVGTALDTEKIKTVNDAIEYIKAQKG